jgi:uncharacterized OB-fold protein
MVVYAVRCDDCGHTRVGRERDGDVVPYRDACPRCGATHYTVPAND